MSYKFRLKSIETGAIHDELGYATTIPQMLEMRERMIGLGVWGQGYVVVDNKGGQYPHFFGTKALYCMKNTREDGWLAGTWYRYPGHAYTEFVQSPEYQTALTMDPNDRLYSAYVRYLNLNDWVIIDHRNRAWKAGRDHHWADGIPNKPGTFALVSGRAGYSWGHTKNRALKTAWMKLPGLWVFCRSRGEFRDSSKVVENLGGGKWQFREDMDPWG